MSSSSSVAQPIKWLSYWRFYCKCTPVSKSLIVSPVAKRTRSRQIRWHKKEFRSDTFSAGRRARQSEFLEQWPTFADLPVAVKWFEGSRRLVRQRDRDTRKISRSFHEANTQIGYFCSFCRCQFEVLISNWVVIQTASRCGRFR